MKETFKNLTLRINNEWLIPRPASIFFTLLNENSVQDNMKNNEVDTIKTRISKIEFELYPIPSNYDFIFQLIYNVRWKKENIYVVKLFNRNFVGIMYRAAFKSLSIVDVIDYDNSSFVKIFMEEANED